MARRLGRRRNSLGIPDSIEADWIASTIAKTVGLPDNASAPYRALKAAALRDGLR